MEGAVFGSFTSSPWCNSGQSYGSGEAFLWRLGQLRNTPCATVSEQIALESNVEVFPWTGTNHNVQYISREATTLALGGGPSEKDGDANINAAVNDNGIADTKSWGFALALNEDLSRGTSGHSTTFDNPSLFGDVFEVANVEVWTLSPTEDLEQATNIELSRQFVFDHGNFLE